MGIPIEKSFVVNAPAGAVWDFLTDPRRVAHCLPGAAITEQVDDKTYAGTMTVKVGPVTAAYRGKLRFDRLDPEAREAELSGTGQETRGKGGADMRMHSRIVERSPTESEVTVRSDVNVVGVLAQFGRGMIQDVSDQLFQKFSDAMRRELEGAATAARPTTGAAEAITGAGATAAVASQPVPASATSATSAALAPPDTADATGGAAVTPAAASRPGPAGATGDTGAAPGAAGATGGAGATDAHAAAAAAALPANTAATSAGAAATANAVPAGTGTPSLPAAGTVAPAALAAAAPNTGRGAGAAPAPPQLPTTSHEDVLDVGAIGSRAMARAAGRTLRRPGFWLAVAVALVLIYWFSHR